MHPYLFWDLILASIWLLFWVLRKDLHREMLFTSLLMLPLGFTQPMFVPGYWNPVVLYKWGGLFDIESFMWCFFTGGIIAILFEELFRFEHFKKRVSGFKHHAHIIYLLLLFFSFLGAYIYLSKTILLIRGLLLIALILTVAFLSIRHDLFIKSISSGLLFTALYIGTLLIVNFIFPDFVSTQWNPAGTLQHYTLGIPLDEYLYALLFGTSWSIIYDVIRGRRLD